MIELLKEQLAEYKRDYNTLEAICQVLAEEGKDWEETAKQAAGYKLLIESTEAEIKKWRVIQKQLQRRGG